MNQLFQALEALHVEIEDESWQHAGHAGAVPGLEATHLRVTVVSPRFEGLSVIQQHRLVHEALKEARATHLHALQLKTMTPDAWQGSKR